MGGGGGGGGGGGILAGACPAAGGGGGAGGGGPGGGGGTLAGGGGGGLSAVGFPPLPGVVTGSGITAGRSGMGMLLPGTDGAMDGPRSAEYIRSPATPTYTQIS